MSKQPKVTGEQQMKIIMANDLRSGLTVFLTASGTWSERADEALIVGDEESASCAMQRAVNDEAASKVTGAYLSDSNSLGEPVELREILRVQGPSIDYLQGRERAPLDSRTYQVQTGI